MSSRTVRGHNPGIAKRLVILGMAFAATLAPVHAGAELGSLFFLGEEGSLVGDQTDTYTEADGAFWASRNFDNGYSVHYEGFEETGNHWDLSFAAADEAVLVPGSYPDAQRYPFQEPGHPGLSIGVNHSGCNTVAGWFNVTEALSDIFGFVFDFAANLEHHCTSLNQPALFASIDFSWNGGSVVPASFSNGNVLLTADQVLREYTREGILVQEFRIIDTPIYLSSTVARVWDITRTVDGKVAVSVFGHDEPDYLYLFDPGSGTWHSETLPDEALPWTLATHDGWYFVPEELSGLLRFDSATDEWVSFAEGEYYRDLTFGADDRLYALRQSPSTIDIFDPSTMSLVGQVALPSLTGEIAVNAIGHIFSTHDDIIQHVSPTGALLDSLATGLGTLTGIQVSPSGDIVGSTASEQVFVTTEALDSFTFFDVDPVADFPLDVTFVDLPLAPVRLFSDGFESGGTGNWSSSN